jgi:hypothetical protein
MTVVGSLDGCATGDWEGRVVVTDGGDAFVYEIVGSGNAADGVVNLRRPIEGDDDVVEEGGDFFCTFVKQEAGCEKREVNLTFAEKIAQSGKIVVQQRFAAGKNDLTNAKVFERAAMTL